MAVGHWQGLPAAVGSASVVAVVPVAAVVVVAVVAMAVALVCVDRCGRCIATTTPLMVVVAVVPSPPRLDRDCNDDGRLVVVFDRALLNLCNSIQAIQFVCRIG